MPKQNFIERKRVAETHPDAPETNRRRTRSTEADESAIAALVNMRNQVVGTPFSAVPAGATPFSAVPAGATPFGAVPVGATPFGAVPVGATPFGAVPAGATLFGAVRAGATPFGAVPAIAALPPPPSNEDMKKMSIKYVYLLPEMTDFIQYYHEIPIKCIRGYIFFMKALEKSGLKVPPFLASTMGFQNIEKRPPYYYHGALQTFVEKSPYRTHFESRLVKYGEVRMMRCEEVEALFRTYVCDNEISGITNQKRSPYEEMSVELSRYLCIFLSLPTGSKMKITDVLQKMNEYVKEKNLLIQSENQILIQLDEKLSQLFMKIKPVAAHMFYVFVRQHFIFENTKHVITHKVSDSGELYIWREGYVSNEDETQHGMCREYYPDGKVKSDGFMIKNQQSGIFRSWYPNGKMRHHTSFCNNLRFDISGYLNEDGTPILQAIFMMNVPIHFKIH